MHQGLSQPIEFGVNIFYVRKHPLLEFDGRCFWNGTDREQKLRYWCATEDEDWERVEKVADAGDYWVVCDYQIVEERTKEAKARIIDTTPTSTYTWTTTASPAYITVNPNGWQNAFATTGVSMSGYIDELVQERFNALVRQATMPATPNGDEIQRDALG